MPRRRVLTHFPQHVDWTRCARRALLQLLLQLLTATLLLVLLLRLALAPQPGDWRVTAGPLHTPVSMPALARLLTAPASHLLLDGPSVPTRFGRITLRRERLDGAPALGVHCAPCRCSPAWARASWRCTQRTGPSSVTPTKTCTVNCG